MRSIVSILLFSNSTEPSELSWGCGGRMLALSALSAMALSAGPQAGALATGLVVSRRLALPLTRRCRMMASVSGMVYQATEVWQPAEADAPEV